MMGCVPEKEKSMIIRNSAKCLSCGEEIESRHVHDCRHCTCRNIMVDGGFFYLRHGWVDKTKYQDTSVVDEREDHPEAQEGEEL
jgi:hypothetical protein